MEEERFKILENLVAHKKRMENSARMNNFLVRFNRHARTIDYGASSREFLKSIKELVKFCKTWNVSFFNRFSIKIDLIVIQQTEG